VRKTLIPAICIALILAVPVFASDAQGQIILGHVTGTVIDAATGLPIANAKVTATIGSNVNGTATTNASGYYNIGGLNGNFTGIVYNVTASKTGYYSSTVAVSMISSVDFVISVNQNLTLTPMRPPTPTPMPAPVLAELPSSAILVAISLGFSLLLVMFGSHKKLPNPLRKRT
jgi:hypothetical protein